MDTRMEEDAWGMVGLLCEGEKVVRRSEYNSEQSEDLEQAGGSARGMGNREGAALVNPSVMTQKKKSYFTLNLGTPDSQKNPTACVVETEIFQLADAVQ